MRELNCAWAKLTASRITPTCLETASLRFAAARVGVAYWRHGGCVEKIIKRESRVVVANGRTGGDREVPKQPAR